MSRYIYVDPHAGTPPDVVLNQPDRTVVYVVPVGQPWSHVVTETLRELHCEVIPSTESVDVGGLFVPARPPWLYLTNLEPFGAGGMSVLYRCRHRETGQRMVLKVVAFQDALQQGLGEMRVSRERIPGLFPVLDTAVRDHDILFLMPEADGIAMPGVHDPMTVLPPVVDALVMMHQAGWVHCDVKPNNILLHAHRAYLTDPGIATRSETVVRAIRCTVRFAPPEFLNAILQRQPVRIEPSADVFSFAVTALVFLKGTHPYGDATNQALLAAHTRGELTQQLQATCRDLTSPWREVLYPALAGRPEERPTMEEILTALKTTTEKNQKYT